MKCFYLLFSLLFFHQCKSQVKPDTEYNKDDNSLLWEVSGRNTTRSSYLFGTFHLMCSDDISLSVNALQAIKKVDEIYFEIDLDDLSNTLAALQFMTMKNDTILSDLYSPLEYKRIESYFKDSLGMPMAIMKKIKPLLLQALLYPKMLACKTSGVEEAVMKVAKVYKKEIKGLETLAFQSSVFDGIPYRQQAKELLKGVDSLGEIKKEFDSLIKIYKTQKMADIERTISSTEFGTAVNKLQLLDNRNKNWVRLLKPVLENNSLFIAVGAGHLAGTKGLINLLKQEGYILKPVQNR